MVYFARIDPLYETVGFEKGYRLVSEERRRRIDRRRSLDAKCRSLGVELLLYKVLAENGISDAVMRRDANGKPFLPSHPDVNISLSHSGRVAAVALSDRPVGCDVQETAAISFERASRRFLSDTEKALVTAAPAEDRSTLLARLWTLKESVVKLTGDGLRTPLSSLELTLGERVTLKGEPAYFFSEYDGVDGYRLAVCGLSETVGRWRERSLSALDF